jgi:hypothetical protein
LIERYPTYEKTLISRIRFAQYWSSLSEDQKKAAIADENMRKQAEKEAESVSLNSKDKLIS